MDDDIASRIAVTALKQYSTLGGNGKPNDSQWTVFAAFVAVIGSHFFVISSATGSKCLGQSQTDENPGGVLRDSHAEVLARRGLLDAIWREMKSHKTSVPTTTDTDNDNYSNSNSNNGDGKESNSAKNLLTRTSIGSFEFRDDLDLYLYISDSPCGDATIYPIDGGDEKFTGAKVVTTASAADDANERFVNTSAGSILPTLDQDINVIREPLSQTTSLLRLKPGRSNLPPASRTRSMSCSDKIVRWSCLSLVGKELRKHGFENESANFKGVVVSIDKVSSQGAQLAALSRALTTRTNGRLLVSVVDAQFSRSKSNNETEKSSPCGLCINFNYTGGVEVTNGSTGKKNGKKKRKAKEDDRSRLCTEIFTATAVSIPVTRAAKPAEYERLRDAMFNTGILKGWVFTKKQLKSKPQNSK